SCRLRRSSSNESERVQGHDGRRARAPARRGAPGAVQPPFPGGDGRAREHLAAAAGQAGDRAHPHGHARARGEPRETRLMAEKKDKKNTKKTEARKPIVRQPKPEHELGRKQERRGVVVSSAMDKTIVVRVETVKVHPRYKKVIRRAKKFHAHDERNEANVGDVVRIVETRPLSRTKSWRLAEVVEVAK